MNTQNSTTPNPLSEEVLRGLKNFKFEIRVRYSETDMSGNPHHSKYFVWLEESRHAILRELGLSYRVMEEEGIFFPIVEANCRLLNPVKMDDIIEIYPKILRANRRFIKMAYIILTREEEPQKVAEAETMNVSVNADGKATSLPPKYLDLMKKLQQIQEAQTNS
ncbi:acyl-CoA thioesterase [Chloroflexota bacterium]